MIWLIGNKGMLGTELSKTLTENGLEFIATDRELDIRDLSILRSFVEGTLSSAKQSKIHWIINCSAYTAVDKAEDEYELAKAINADGLANIAHIANEIDAAVLHISTDYVFDGNGIKGDNGALRGYLEADTVNPLGAYGKSKLQGEQALVSICPKHIILRTAWLYGQFGPNFVSTMLRLMKEKDSVGIVADQSGSPTWAADLAMTIVSIVKHKQASWGIFHASGEGICTWFDFAKEIQVKALELGILLKKAELIALSTEQYPTKTKRPSWSVLDKSKLKQAYNIVFPVWQSSLAKYLESLKE